MAASTGSDDPILVAGPTPIYVEDIGKILKALDLEMCRARDIAARRFNSLTDMGVIRIREHLQETGG